MPPEKTKKPRRASTASLNASALVKNPGTLRKKTVAAGPSRQTRKARIPAPAEALDRLQSLIVESLDADKAEDIVTIDLVGRTSFADRMVIATGIADRQIAAMAMHLDEKLREAGVRRVHIEGGMGSDWVLIDAGDIIVHLFKPAARALYGLEKMWAAELDIAEPSHIETS